jgi:hypothetical protein
MKLILSGLFLSLFTFAQAQELKKWQLNDAGLDVQAYPAGAMLMGRVNFNLNQKNQFVAKLGYNLARRQDFGQHDNEEGGGFGVNIGFKHYFNPNYLGWHYGLRTSIWMMNIDWSNNSPAATGATFITVFQPTVTGGYDFAVASKLKLGIFVAFGYEINVVTTGQEVGQGGISLAGFTLTHKIR